MVTVLPLGSRPVEFRCLLGAHREVGEQGPAQVQGNYLLAAVAGMASALEESCIEYNHPVPSLAASVILSGCHHPMCLSTSLCCL